MQNDASDAKLGADPQNKTLLIQHVATWHATVLIKACCASSIGKLPTDGELERIKKSLEWLTHKVNAIEERMRYE